MKIEQTTFGPWSEAWRLTRKEVEMIVVSQIGPRIISLRLGGGPNILFDDSVGTFARKNWKIWGGHRFWVSPETEQSYQPDNDSCETRVDGERLIVTGSVDPCGLQKILEIAPCPSTAGGFEIIHHLVNRGPMLASGAIWGLTCVAPEGRVVISWGEGTAEWRTQMVRYWLRWGGGSGTSCVGSTQWKPNDEFFLVEPSGEMGKVGLFSDGGYMALLRPDATFIKRFDVVAGATYPDGGCNVELYTCEKFIEMETLSPTQVLHPNERITHIERWDLIGRTFAPEEIGSIKS